MSDLRLDPKDAALQVIQPGDSAACHGPKNVIVE